MKVLLVLEARIKGVRQSTVIAKGVDDINRVAICYQGIRGYINRSGAILCREIEANKIIDKSEEVSCLLRKLFPNDFKQLYIASTNDLDNPARQDKRDAYYRH